MAQDPTPSFSPAQIAALREIPADAAPSPAFVLHRGLLEENCRILQETARRSGAKILLALKGFACHAAFPLIRRYLSGTTASGLHEALLAREEFGGEVHAYSVAFKKHELERLAGFAHTIVFNTPAQLAAGLPVITGKTGQRPEIGLRVNPECSQVETAIYDPCAPGSRLGLTREALDKEMAGRPKDFLDHVDGLHFHTLCEQNADALERAVAAFEANFGDLLHGLSWVNFGGGHHITRADYDLDRLQTIIRRFRERYHVDVYLEPGEAVALQTGILVATVLDVFETGGSRIAVLDTSATCHMPDILEMPYRPPVLDAGAPGEHAFTYRLGGLSCLAGDVIGDYSFAAPLEPGQRLVFLDMAHYTMVKTTTFNGVPLPSICSYDRENGLHTIRRFGYEDYRERLS